MNLKITDILLVMIALVSTGIILEVGLVYGEMLTAWPIWEPVTETAEPNLILGEM